MRRPLNSRERRIAAVTVLALLLAALYYLLLELPLLAPLRQFREEAAQLRAQQQQYAGMLQREPALREQLRRAQQDPQQRDSLLPGEDPNAVAAELMRDALQRVERQAARGAGCEVTQRMPVATTPQGESEPYRQVAVSLTLSCASEPLMRVLHDLEYGQPSLFVDQLSIRRPSAAPSSGGPGRLDVQLFVRGYMRAAADTDSDAVAEDEE